MAGYLSWGMMVGVLPRKKAFETYVQQLCSRPAALRAEAMDAVPGQAQQG